MDRIIYEKITGENSERDSLNSLIDEVKLHKNELVINGLDICLLLDGIVVDGEDYYYRLVEPERGLVYSSCVGRIDYLKGKIDDTAYDYIWGIFKMNYKRWGDDGTAAVELHKKTLKEIGEVFGG